MLGAEDAHLELADRDEAILGAWVRAIEVDEAHRRAVLAGLAVLADAGIAQQQVMDAAVVLQEALSGEAGQLLQRFVHLVRLQPGIDPDQLLAQHRFQHHLRE